MLATVTTMARWANDVMNAIDANDWGGPWGMATTLEFPKITLYLLITTSTDVASGFPITNIIHYATVPVAYTYVLLPLRPWAALDCRCSPLTARSAWHTCRA